MEVSRGEDGGLKVAGTPLTAMFSGGGLLFTKPAVTAEVLVTVVVGLVASGWFGGGMACDDGCFVIPVFTTNGYLVLDLMQPMFFPICLYL